MKLNSFSKCFLWETIEQEQDDKDNDIVGKSIQSEQIFRHNCRQLLHCCFYSPFCSLALCNISASTNSASKAVMNALGSMHLGIITSVCVTVKCFSDC